MSAAAVAAAKEMVSYTRGDRGVEVKHFRPKTRNEARQLVKEIFAKQGSDGWDERSQFVYMSQKGIDPKPVEELSVDELRIIVDSFEANRMVIFAS